jgi:hypothetical protein
LRRLIYVLIVVSVFVLSGGPYAVAEGGQSIATAPTVIFGTQEFGSIKSHNEGGCKAWWLLPAVAGDKFQIDWEVQSDPYVVLHLYLRKRRTTGMKEGNERVLHRRSSESRWPRPCVGDPRGRSEALDTGCAQAGYAASK